MPITKDDEDDTDDETVIKAQEDSGETIQIQGSDRRYPAIVRRAAYYVDTTRTTIQTISRKDRQGNINPLYDEYLADIEAYRKRRKSATRRDRPVRSVGTRKGRLALQNDIAKEERGPDLHEPGYMDPRSENQIVLAKGVDNEKYK